MIVAYIDGASRGNPGPSGYGVRLENEDGSVIDELRGFIGISTNNVAEYHGLLSALQYALERDLRSIRIRSDSLLLVKQMQGEYRVKHPRLQTLHQQAGELTRSLTQVSFEHVPREQNVEADRLANLAMDEAEAAQRS